ncbi:hypothetical protein BZG35_13850 [Brevundimonas sp. LM2]|uniref:hypothetical protein n=1 Tax=Brevundimonas sp. LM2 TaxID=1938605 RepID=UPI000983DD44|nr:hypothetical protein [Brevundimonas sp. LM2]AQR62609.1 hypothetical protein BZG35_13850 [Brevundimonas sp. LM2]
MTDQPINDDDQPHFETSDVEANVAMEQGLGVGARELAAQRDAGGVVTADVDDSDGEVYGDEDEDEEDDEVEPIDRNTSVLGEDPEA